MLLVRKLLAGVHPRSSDSRNIPHYKQEYVIFLPTRSPKRSLRNNSLILKVGTTDGTSARSSTGCAIWKAAIELLIAMANGLHPTSDGLQPNCNGLPNLLVIKSHFCAQHQYERVMRPSKRQVNTMEELISLIDDTLEAASGWNFRHAVSSYRRPFVTMKRLRREGRKERRGPKKDPEYQHLKHFFSVFSGETGNGFERVLHL